MDRGNPDDQQRPRRNPQEVKSFWRRVPHPSLFCLGGSFAPALNWVGQTSVICGHLTILGPLFCANYGRESWSSGKSCITTKNISESKKRSHTGKLSELEA